MQEPARGKPRRPFVVAVAGLKNSGKTTAAGALVSALSGRGYRVAAVKTSHLPRLDLDPADRDSRRLYDAGAVCVVAQGGEETLVVRRQERPAPMAELLGLMPAGIDYVVVEGGVPAEADLTLVCLKTLRDFEETLAVRRVPRESVRALTGLAAAGSGGAESPAREAAAGPPLIDAATPEGREALVRLVLTSAGAPGAG